MRFGDIEREFRRPLLSYFRRRLGKPQEAEDLVQDVFLKLGQKADLNVVDNPQGYIFKIASNQLKDHVRREVFRKQDNHVSLGDLLTEAFTTHHLVEEIEPERILMAKHRLAGVGAVLDQLSERTRSVFLLYRVDGMTRREIADHHSISVSAVDKHLARAIASVTKHLEASDGE